MLERSLPFIRASASGPGMVVATEPAASTSSSASSAEEYEGEVTI